MIWGLHVDPARVRVIDGFRTRGRPGTGGEGWYRGDGRGRGLCAFGGMTTFNLAFLLGGEKSHGKKLKARGKPDWGGRASKFVSWAEWRSRTTTYRQRRVMRQETWGHERQVRRGWEEVSEKQATHISTHTCGWLLEMKNRGGVGGGEVRRAGGSLRAASA